jgi:large repetitive protein
VRSRSAAGARVRALGSALVGGALLAALIAPAALAAAPTIGITTITTNEDTAATPGNVLDVVTGTGTVTVVSYTDVSASKGHLTVATDGAYTFTPAANWNGSTTTSYYLHDDTGNYLGYVNIHVTAVNDLPTAADQSTSTNEDVAKAITLGATDVDQDTLTYTVVDSPTHGSLTGSGASRTYTPDENWSGSDSFTFKVNDGTGDSNTAIVSITVNAVNDPPVPQAKSTSTNEDTAVDVSEATLLAGATDAEGDTITLVGVGNPTGGTVSMVGTDAHFVPTANLNGVAAGGFDYTVTDGTDQATAHVTIDITAVDDVPVATPQTVNVREDIAKAITLAGSDVETTVTFAIVDAPAHGDLSGSAPNVTYTPTTGYTGDDSFTFKTNDGAQDSAPATVTIHVLPNNVPVATPQSVNVVFDVARGITLAGTDADTDDLTYAVAAQPQHGTLSGTAPNLTYTPTAGYNGPDSFTFTVSDYLDTSTPATVTITVAPDAVAPVVDAPVVQFGAGRVNETAPLKISWNATDTGVGVGTYTVQAKVGTGAWTTIYTGAAKSITKFYAFNTNVQFQVKAADTLGNASGYVATPIHKILAYQGGSPVAYTGTWSSVKNTNASGTGYKYNTVKGKRVSGTFTGIQFAYVGDKLSSGGYVKVQFDSGTIGRYNLKSTTTRWGVIVRKTGLMASGSHTVKVWNDQAGRRAIFDAFLVLR